MSLEVTEFGTDRRPVCDFLLLPTYILCRTVSELSRPIGQIIAVDRGRLYLTDRSG